MYFRVKLLFILTGCIISHSAIAHEFNFGFFEIFRERQNLFVEIRLDEDKLAKALQESFDLDTKAGFNSTWECYIKDYLEEKMNLGIEDHPAELVFISFEADQNMIIVLTQVNNPPARISQVKVTNTVLLEIADNQTNIIRSSLNGRSRSFRLSKERTSTTIEY